MSRKITPKHPGMIRNGIYDINTVLSKCCLPHEDPSGFKPEVDFDGDKIKMTSHRYLVFKHYGIACAVCGIEGSFFAKERDKNSKRFHFNLYAVDENGQEVLITKDHVIPKSKGGKNHLSNYQTMCKVCNEKKGNTRTT